MNLTELHDCEKCHGKIVMISIDALGLERCGYCNETVNYKDFMMKQLSNKIELCPYCYKGAGINNNGKWKCDKCKIEYFKAEIA